MGIAFAAPPGAVTAETLRRGVRGGFALAMGVQLGSLIGDAAYAVLAIAGLAALAQNSSLQLALGVLGAGFLLYLAWTSFATARLSMPIASIRPARAEGQGAFLSGLALSLTNPWAIAFWLSLGGATASLGLARGSSLYLALFFASFMVGSAIWACILSFAIARVRRWVRPVFFRLISITCGLMLGALGLGVAARVAFQILGI